MSKPNKIPRQRNHNPSGGGYKPVTQTHKLRTEKKAKDLLEKIQRNGKLTKKDLKEIIENGE